jgi:hypothetical protein
MDEQPGFTPLNLIELATQGDAQAVGALLQTALNNPAWQLQALAGNRGLQVFLLGEQLPNQSEGTRLIQAAFSQWPSMPWPQVTIESYVIGATVPTWVSEFGLQPSGNAPGSRPMPPDPLRRPSLQSSRSHPLTVPPGGTLAPQARHFATTRPASSAVIKPRPPEVRRLGSETMGALITGLVLAIPLMAIGLLRTLFQGFLVMVHELGHAATYWLFGYPAVPAVNLLYGGGITLSPGRVWFLVWVILAGLAYLSYRYRRSTNTLSWLIATTGLYSLCAFTDWHTRLMAYMGHGAETLAIILCLYFAMGGYFCKWGGERSIYAMLGFFTWFADIQFAWGLLYDATLQANYVNGIGGVIDNDFVVLAGSLGVRLGAIATFFLITSLLAPLVAILGFRYEPYWQRACLRL